jgi:hypothetical protein
LGKGISAIWKNIDPWSPKLLVKKAYSTIFRKLHRYKIAKLVFSCMGSFGGG